MISNMISLASSAHDEQARTEARKAADHAAANEQAINALGGVDTSESGVAGVTYAFARYDANVGRFVGMPAPGSPPVNEAYAESNYSLQGGASDGGSTTLKGIPAGTMQGSSIDARIRIGEFAAGLANGESFDAVVLFSPASSGGDNDNNIRLTILSDGELDLIRLHYAGPDAGLVEDHYGMDLPVDQTWPAAENYVVDLGDNVFLAKVRVTATGAIAGPIYVGANRHSDNVDVTVAALYIGATDGYLYDNAGDAGAVNVPGYAPLSDLTLDSSANQKATIDGDDLVLVLPSAPAADTVAEYTLRVDVTGGGSLTLPSDAGITIYGDAGPFTTSALVAIRHYDDGSADLVVRGS